MLKKYYIHPELLQPEIDINYLSAENLHSLIQNFKKSISNIDQDRETWQKRIVNAWVRVARQWETWSFEDADNLLNQLEKTTRMSRPVLRESIANHFRVVRVSDLTKWQQQNFAVKEEEQHSRRSDSFVFLISSGNIPGAAIHPIIQLSLLGIPVIIKCSSHEPYLLPTLIHTLAHYDAEAASRLLVLTWPREEQQLTQTVLAHKPDVVTFGSDDTVTSLRSMSSKAYAPMGDHFSIVILQALNLKVEMLRQLAYDFIMFDGKGCLGPQVVCVIADDWQDVVKLAGHFSGIMMEEIKLWPAGQWTPAEKAMIQQWRGEWQARNAAGEEVVLYHPDDTSWTVVAADKFDLSVRVAYRVVRFLWCKDSRQAEEILKQHTEKIHALAIEVDPDFDLDVISGLDENSELLGRSITTPGHLQRPAFDWMDINKSWNEMLRRF